MPESPFPLPAERSSLAGGRYELRTKLGEGGKGVVFVGRDTALDRVVAVKVLKLEGLDEESYARFVNEAQIAARLTHPNIVALFDIGREDGRPFLVMELVEGSSLRGLIERSAAAGVPLDQAVEYASQTARALEYAHSKGVLHRDVKPENILVTNERTVKLMDFGLARALDRPRLTAVGTMVGTPAYMAPENALGAEADPRSDLYSLGIVLYELATGAAPFRSPDSLKLIYSHLHDAPVAPSRANARVPAALEAVILRLLAKDPADRYRSATDLLRALDSLDVRTAVASGSATVSTPSPATGAERTVPTPEASRIPTPEYRRSLPLVGRETEVVTLKGFVDALLRGEGTTVMVTGEAGVGKTRVSDEMKAYAHLRGVRLVTGRCQEAVGGAPYFPWVELLQGIIRTATPAELARWAGSYSDALAKLVPEVAERLPISTSAPMGSPEQHRVRLFEGISRFLLNLSRETPIIVDLCNLNWADPASLELIGYFAREVRRQFVMVYLTYRDVEVEDDSPLARLLFELNRERLGQTVQIPRLNREDVGRMMTEMFQRETTPEFLDLVFSRTRGNPFFVEEVLRSLVEEGAIYRNESGRWERRPIAEIEIPSSVRKVIEHRLGRIDDESHQALRVASIQGNEFRFDVLREVMEAEEGRLIDLLERCLKTRLIRERRVSPRRVAYFFTDERVRDVLYDEMSHIRRSKYHLKTALVLEKEAHGREEAIAGELAHHFLMGNDAPKALDYSLVAGESAMRLYGHRDAYAHFSTALELIEESDAVRRTAVFERLGDAAFSFGQAEPALKHWGDALAGAERLGEEARVATLCVKIGYAHHLVTFDREKMLSYYGRALRILESRPPSAELAALYQLIARGRWFIGDQLDEASAMCDRAYDLAVRLHAPEPEAEALLTRCLLLPVSQRAEAARAIDRAMAIGKEHNLSHVTARAYLNAFQTAAVDGEIDRALEISREGLEYARRTGEVTYSVYLICMEAFLGHLPRGEWGKVREAATQTSRLAPAQTSAQVFAFPRLVLAYVHWAEGDLDHAEDLFRQVLRRVGGMFEALYVSPTYAGLACVALDRGEIAGAETEALAGLEHVRHIGSRGLNARYYVVLHAIMVEIRVRQADRPAAIRAVEELRQAVTEVDRPWANAYGQWGEGRLAQLEVRAEEALTHLRASAAEFERMGWPFERARVLLDLAAAEQSAGKSAAAATTLSTAMEIFSHLGARGGVHAVLRRKEILKA